MAKRIITFCMVVALGLACSTVLFGQEAAKKEVKKDEVKMEATTTVEKMGLKSVSCPPECGFMVRSHDEKEIISMTRSHAVSAHKKKLSEKEVRGMMKTEVPHVHDEKEHH